jgi:hypothetical protein
MKNLVVFLAIVFVMLAASCTQRTCPTYTKGTKEFQQKPNSDARVLKQV